MLFTSAMSAQSPACVPSCAADHGEGACFPYWSWCWCLAALGPEGACWTQRRHWHQRRSTKRCSGTVLGQSASCPVVCRLALEVLHWTLYWRAFSQQGERLGPRLTWPTFPGHSCEQLHVEHCCRMLPCHELPVSLAGLAEVWRRPRMWTATL